MKNIIATLSSVLALEIATINAARQFYHVQGGLGLDKRQIIHDCYGSGNTCAENCGQGYITCAVDGYCFDPSAGDTCCANGGGTYCPSGWYCVTVPGGGASCCPAGDSLDQCHASVSVNPVATDATLASTGASASRSSSPSSSSGANGLSSSSSSGAQITGAAVMWGAEAIGLAAAGFGVFL